MSNKLDKKVIGAWLIHHTNKLQQIENTGSFDRIELAGKAGLLLSALAESTDESILNNSKVNAIAKAAHISTSLELPTLLLQLEKDRLISRSSSGEVSILGITTANVLRHIADIFEAAEPDAKEIAVINIAELASHSPIQSSSATEFVSDTYKLTTLDAQELLKASEYIGFVDAEDIDSSNKLYFNGNLFRRNNTKKISAVLSSLSPFEHQTIQDLEALFQNSVCVSRQDAIQAVSAELLDKLQSIGMYDMNTISNERERVDYLTKPAAFNKYSDALIDDALHLAKAFVTSLSYGISYSTHQRGKITMLSLLMNKLIRGEWVGPATAIGQDYKALELKRVIEVRPELSGLFSMRLLKRDVGELALQALTEGDVSERSLPALKGASITNYLGPEKNRELVRRLQTTPSKRQVADILRTLRMDTTL